MGNSELGRKYSRNFEYRSIFNENNHRNIDLYVDQMDASEIQIRPVNALRLENVDPYGIGKPADYRCCDFSIWKLINLKMS